MFNTITTALRRIFNTQHSIEKTHNSNSINIPTEKQIIVEKENIKDTPFWLLKIEQGWFLAMGDNRLSEIYKTKKEALNHLEKNHWNIIMQLILIVEKTLKKEVDGQQDKILNENQKLKKLNNPHL